MNEMTPIDGAGRNTPEPPAPPTPEQVVEYLDYALTGLITRRTEIRDALLATIAAHPKIEDGDDETNGILAENRRMAETLGKTAKGRFTEFKRPWIDGGNAVGAWFARFDQPLAGPLAEIRRIMDAYADRQEDIRRRAAQAEADRKRKEADAAAAEAAAALARAPQAEETSEALNRAAETAGKADDADQHASARASEHTRTYGQFGAVSSVRTIWKWRTTNESAVPRQYLTISEDKVKAALKAAPRAPDGRPQITIPGIEVYSEKRTQVR
jgi:hypothetical protein